MIRKIGVPIPLQVLLVLLGIPLSSHFQFHDQFNVSIVGHIPQKLPDPSDSMPDFGIIKDDPTLLLDCLAIALVGFGFTLCIGLAILIMTYRNYKIDILEFGTEDDDSHSTSQSNFSNSSVLRVSCTIHLTNLISQFYKSLGTLQ